MAKPFTIKNIPADEIDAMTAAMVKLGATGVKKTKNDDGTYNLDGTFP